MGFDAKNFDISKLMGTTTGFDLGNVTEQQGPSAAGLASLQESVSASEGGSKQQPVQQDSPTLPPPGGGARTSIEESELDAKLIGELLALIPQALEFETAVKEMPTFLNFDLSEEAKKDLEEYYSSDIAVNITLLRKIVTQIMQGFLNTHPKAPESIKGNLASLQMDIFKDNYPISEFPLSALQQLMNAQSEEGQEVDKGEVAQQFFNDLQKYFQDHGRNFDVFGDSDFTLGALEQLSVSYLMQAGLTEEEAIQFTELNISAIGLAKALTNWSENFKTTLSKAEGEPKPNSVETAESRMESLRELLKETPLDEKQKTSILEFMAKIAKAIQDLKQTIDEIMKMDAKRRREELKGRKEGISEATKLLDLVKILKDEEVKRLLEEVMKYATELIEEDLEREQTTVGEIDENSQLELQNSELVEALEELFGVDISEMTLAEFKEFIEDPFGPQKVGQNAQNSKEELAGGLQAIVVAGVLAFIERALQEQEETAGGVGGNTSGIGGTFQEQMMDLVMAMIADMSKLGGSGAVSQESLSRIDHASNNLIEQMKALGIDTAGMQQAVAGLNQLANLQVPGEGSSENKIAAFDLMQILMGSILGGEKVITDMSNGLSAQLATAYLNDLALLTLSLTLFMTEHGVAGDEVAGEMGKLVGAAVTLGFAAGLLAAGAGADDVQALLDTLQSMTETIMGADFANYLAGELVKATGQDPENQGQLSQILTGILSALGGAAATEEEIEELAELVKSLRKAIATLERLLQNMLGQVQTGNMPPAEAIDAAVKAYQQVIEELMKALLPDSDDEALDKLIEKGAVDLQEQLTSFTTSPQGAQFLINAMLAAGFGPASQGLGQNQMAA